MKLVWLLIAFTGSFYPAVDTIATPGIKAANRKPAVADQIEAAASPRTPPNGRPKSFPWFLEIPAIEQPHDQRGHGASVARVTKVRGKRLRELTNGEKSGKLYWRERLAILGAEKPAANS